ncbi:polysaccharide pyruvyl transferase family protein [Gramella lutea]|uniref:Polysaccharide pyruvyl transferase family protein n=1 Tax=Christiangramia lutea TaxID=1607951 RepID=A0A9X1UZS1_9FLAO|nr:polysaccharide pyruvyl transferase family protein [Christiangramia lutea]MCH4821597.1 polysaccharide pyruvyl transferase family protein [Christiangramia lutea]
MVAKKSKISLFYWSEIKFAGRSEENYGDLLSKYIVEKLSGWQVKWVQPKKQSWYKINKKNYLAIGSIIHHANSNSVVWGSGIIDQKQLVQKAKFLAVRGPRTRDYLLSKNYNCPEVYGDPGILLPLLYNPSVKKKYPIGIIPHYTDYNEINKVFDEVEGVKVIDLLCKDVEQVTREIFMCEKTISSSLHGLIVSHAYNIPSIWVEFSDNLFGDGIKFLDYFESVGMQTYIAKTTPGELVLTQIQDLFEKFPNLPEEGIIQALQKGLLNAFPLALSHSSEKILEKLDDVIR